MAAPAKRPRTESKEKDGTPWPRALVFNTLGNTYVRVVGDREEAVRASTEIAVAGVPDTLFELLEDYIRDGGAPFVESIEDFEEACDVLIRSPKWRSRRTIPSSRSIPI